MVLLISSCTGFVQSVKDEHAVLMSKFELSQMIKKDAPVLIIDVRPEIQYQNSHIPGAKNIPYYEFESQINKLNKFIRIVIYDQDFTHVKTLIKQLKYYEYNDAYMLSGGFSTWDYPVEKE